MALHGPIITSQTRDLSSHHTATHPFPCAVSGKPSPNIILLASQREVHLVLVSRWLRDLNSITRHGRGEGLGATPESSPPPSQTLAQPSERRQAAGAGEDLGAPRTSSFWGSLVTNQIFKVSSAEQVVERNKRSNPLSISNSQGGSPRQKDSRPASPHCPPDICDPQM